MLYLCVCVCVCVCVQETIDIWRDKILIVNSICQTIAVLIVYTSL